ncbi:MAG: Rab family GTPase [Promethearchaeota archaeon]|jgi:small GTP-binding protein
MSEKQPKNLALKLALLGDPAVGKTSLINRYIQHRFQADYMPTLGVNIVVKELHFEDLNAFVRIVLWDIAGQSKYDLSRKMFFQGCVGALCVYDTTRHATFKNIETKWLNDLKQYSEKEPAYLLIGNKTDLKDSKAVSAEEGQKLAEKINASSFVETSAKSGDNVEHAFKKLVNSVLINLGLTK